jgi:sugar lactone lactonase YvrE
MASRAQADASPARCVWPVRAILGEGPVHDARDEALYFVDIKGQRLHRLSLRDNAQTSWDMPEPIGWVLPRASSPGFIAGFKSGFATVTLAPFAITPIGAPEPDRETNRLNDAKVDPCGRIWAGSMDDAEKRVSGALYRLDPTLTWSRMDDGYGVANGPTFSPAGDVLYHADSARRIVYRFALSADGLISERREFVRFPEDWGYPDGMTTDCEGGVWIAHWDGARISRFTPDGLCDRAVPMPVSRPTSCVFAGAGRDRLFVTSASIGRESESLAGGLFELDVGMRGAPSFAFAG